MAKTPKLDNASAMGLHLAAGLEDDFLSEAQYILDDTASTDGKKVSIQETIDSLKDGSVTDWTTEQDIDDMFVECVSDSGDS